MTFVDIDCVTSLSSAETIVAGSDEVCYRIVRPADDSTCYVYFDSDPGKYMEMTWPESPFEVRIKFLNYFSSKKS